MPRRAPFRAGSDAPAGPGRAGSGILRNDGPVITIFGGAAAGRLPEAAGATARPRNARQCCAHDALARKSPASGRSMAYRAPCSVRSSQLVRLRARHERGRGPRDRPDPPGDAAGRARGPMTAERNRLSRSESPGPRSKTRPTTGRFNRTSQHLRERDRDPMAEVTADAAETGQAEVAAGEGAG